MNKAYILSTCDTCRRILKEVEGLATFEIQDIKTAHLSQEQLEELYQHSQSYEALFNKRSRKYKELGLKDQQLTEEQLKAYILEEYTFLKRPVFLVGNKMFAGNAKKTVEALKTYLQTL
ncbi:arsenate reductase [Puteibacter caeruleilacunae]|nr:arsenate reductase [Puteibacter caeruleilacunae]